MCSVVHLKNIKIRSNFVLSKRSWALVDACNFLGSLRHAQETLEIFQQAQTLKILKWVKFCCQKWVMDPS